MRRVALMLLCLLPARMVLADGGRVAFVGPCGDARATVVVSPAPPAAGSVEVGVLLVDAAGERVAGQPIRVSASDGSAHTEGIELRHDGSVQWFAVPMGRPGEWTVRVEAGGACEFVLRVQPAPPRWTLQIPWILLVLPMLGIVWLRERACPLAGR